MKSVGIIGLGAYVPPKKVTNFDFEKVLDTSDEWIRTRTGIEERYFVEGDIATSDLATEAAKIAIEEAKLTKEDIDMVIVATATPDMFFPSTACIVQKNLELKNASAFDMTAGCTGFVYALTVAANLVRSGFSKNVLVIGAETLSKIANIKDRATAVLFGDGAGAAIVSEVDDETGFLAEHLSAQGDIGHHLTLPAGGSRLPASFKTIEEGKHFIYMNGSEVFKFSTRVVTQEGEAVLNKANLNAEQVDWLVTHQANLRIIDAAIERFKFDRNKVLISLNKFGNTSAASIPITIDLARKEGKIKKGDNMLLIAFGAGMTSGSIVLKWSLDK